MKENTLNKLVYIHRRQISRYVKILTCCCLLAMVSCKAKKQIIVNRAAPVNAPKPPNDKLARLNAIRASQVNFNTFSGKAKTKLDIGGSSNDVTLNIRIKRDQKIWVSVTAIAGIEVARAQITPDSILVINRLQSVYIRQPFAYITRFAGEQVNYKTLEALLAGNIIPGLLNENTDIQPANGTFTLSGDLRGLMYKIITGPDMKASQTNLNNPNAGQSLQVVNSAFTPVGNYIVPSQIDMSSIVKDKKIQVNLHYTKIEFDKPLDFPFSIPARYTPAD
ncbi:MAG: hypothetical protein JWR02_327 [Mucilaginibacter sp.]|nr:hypothetical protein [Mucilaginibacter sp.]